MEKIFNFHYVLDQISAGGQPSIHQFKSIKDAEIEVVLQIVVKEAEYPVETEAQHLERLGIEHKIMYMSFGNPTLDNVADFMDIMRECEGRKIFVHCAAGYCTSGLLVIYLMQSYDMTYSDAKDLVLSEWQPAPQWFDLIDQATAFSRV